MEVFNANAIEFIMFSNLLFLCLKKPFRDCSDTFYLTPLLSLWDWSPN